MTRKQKITAVEKFIEKFSMDEKARELLVRYAKGELDTCDVIRESSARVNLALAKIDDFLRDEK